MSRTSLAFVMLLVLSSPALAAPEGEGADKAAAARLLAEGNDLFQAKKFEPALARYEAAYQRYASPKIFLNLGKTQSALGRFVEAAALFERFLRESGVDPGSPLEREAQSAWQALPKIGTLALSSAVLGVEVFVDGKAVGVLPLDPVRVMPGEHDVQAQKPGYQTVRQNVRVEAGAASELRLQIMPVVSDVRPPPPPPAPPPPIVATPVPPAPAASDDDSGSLVIWVVLGAVAVVGTAVVIGIAAASSGGEYTPSSDLGSSKLDDWQQL